MISKLDVLGLLATDRWTPAEKIINVLSVAIIPEHAARMYVSHMGGKKKNILGDLGHAVSQGKRRGVLIVANKAKSEGLIESQGHDRTREYRLLPAGLEYREQRNDKIRLRKKVK